VISEDLLITLPAEGEATTFLLQFQIEESVTGFQYEAGTTADS
jgi:hypothetical protein